MEKIIVAYYSPPDNLSPAVLRVLIRQSTDIKDILATIVDLAVRGYIRIREEKRKMLFVEKTDYIFEKIKNESDLKFFEQKIIKSVFGNRNIVSSLELRNKFYKKIPDINKEIYKETAKTGLFAPTLVRKELEIKRQALGFRRYLLSVERFRMGAETIETFSKFLPYAMVFGMEKQWADRFSDFFNFSSSFSSFASSISSAFSSSPGGSGVV